MEISNIIKVFFNTADVVPYPTAPQGPIKVVANLNFVVNLILF
jgi:hypothetical protein